MVNSMGHFQESQHWCMKVKVMHLSNHAKGEVQSKVVTNNIVCGELQKN